MVFDANNKQVGQLIGTEAKPAFIRYTLATGDAVLLEAFPYGLRQAGPAVPAVYFLNTTNCSGPTAYVDPTVMGQLTRRQATVVNEYSSPLVLTRSELYVSVPFPATTQMPAGQVALSRYQSGTCIGTSFPLGGAFLVAVTKTENLLTKFAIPFWTP